MKRLRLSEVINRARPAAWGLPQKDAKTRATGETRRAVVTAEWRDGWRPGAIPTDNYQALWRGLPSRPDPLAVQPAKLGRAKIRSKRLMKSLSVWVSGRAPVPRPKFVPARSRQCNQSWTYQRETDSHLTDEKQQVYYKTRTGSSFFSVDFGHQIIYSHPCRPAKHYYWGCCRTGTTSMISCGTLHRRLKDFSSTHKLHKCLIW